MNHSGRGRFITLEGIEGAGKSSHVAAICEHLKSGGRRVVATREPGGTALGEALRGLLLDPDNRGMGSDAELLLMFAARAEHVRSVVRPALEDGAWVVCDRFTDATYAYQGGGRGIVPERVAILEDWVQGSLRPDLVLLLDLAVDVGLARVAHRGSRDRFEQEQAAFFERVRAAYLARSRAHPERYRVVDASAPIDSVRERILDAVEAFCR